MLYERIKALCEERGISIARLEREAGIANATISGWITGFPSIRTIKAVADVLQVSIDELIDGIDFNVEAYNDDSN